MRDLLKLREIFMDKSRSDSKYSRLHRTSQYLFLHFRIYTFEFCWTYNTFVLEMLTYLAADRVLRDNSINTDEHKSDGRTLRMKFVSFFNAPFRESQSRR